MSLYLLAISLSLYVVSSSLYLAYLAFYRKGIERLGHYTLLMAFMLHLCSTMVRYIQAGYTPITNLFESLSFFSLCIAGVFLYLKKFSRINALGGIILPPLCIMLLWSVTLPAGIRPLPPVLDSYWLPIHTGFSFVGNAFFFISFFVSIVYLIVERGIKKKNPSSVSSRMPSLETLDLINHRCMSYGFPFLTMGIITGSIWASGAWGSYWSWDPKETWSLITWIVYAILLHNRLAIGWRGRKTAYMMILGFFSILLTFLGVNFLIGGLHSYV
jgi:cytochrome c-type biogenesis protein CcsB